MSAVPAESPRESLILPDLLATCAEALAAAESFNAAARSTVALLVAPGGKVDATLLEQEQFAVHGYSWLATYVAALREMLHWAERLEAARQFGDLEQMMLQAAYGEYLSQLAGGIALSQVEVLRPADLGLAEADGAALQTPAVRQLMANGNGNALRMAIARHLAEGRFGEAGLADEMLEMIRDQFRKVAEDHKEDAHEWHLKDALIPLEVVEQLAGLGVFGLTVPEDFGGSGLGKLAMCVVTEELSRGYIGLGSLGTRSEIAAELIRLGGTPAQQEKWLPLIASGEILPTAVFTEPNTGSDLGSLRTRALRDGVRHHPVDADRADRQRHHGADG